MFCMSMWSLTERVGGRWGWSIVLHVGDDGAAFSARNSVVIS